MEWYADLTTKRTGTIKAITEKTWNRSARRHATKYIKPVIARVWEKKNKSRIYFQMSIFCYKLVNLVLTWIVRVVRLRLLQGASGAFTIERPDVQIQWFFKADLSLVSVAFNLR